MIFTPIDFRIDPNADPIGPYPIIPTVLPFNSQPIFSCLLQSADRISIFAREILCDKFNSKPRVCSAKAFIFPSAAFKHKIPFSSAYSVSIFSKPDPNRPIHFKLIAFFRAGLSKDSLPLRIIPSALSRLFDN